jgi:hypothetical protein
MRVYTIYIAYKFEFVCYSMQCPVFKHFVTDNKLLLLDAPLWYAFPDILHCALSVLDVRVMSINYKSQSHDNSSTRR